MYNFPRVFFGPEIRPSEGVNVILAYNFTYFVTPSCKYKYKYYRLQVTKNCNFFRSDNESQFLAPA